jgi:RHS repeat-associated protein
VFLSNEHPTQVDVYFDDLKVTFAKSRVVQMDDYYPFGLTFNHLARENNVSQNYKFNGKEEQKDLDLAWLDFGARMYMAEIGRWGAVDPLANRFIDMSPYAYCNNNPVRFTDPTGMENEDSNDGPGKKKQDPTSVDPHPGETEIPDLDWGNPPPKNTNPDNETGSSTTGNGAAGPVGGFGDLAEKSPQQGEPTRDKGGFIDGDEFYDYMKTRAKTWKIEVAAVVLKDGDDYKYFILPWKDNTKTFSNSYADNLSDVLAGKTLQDVSSWVHTHNMFGDPKPSPGDKRLGDNYKKPIYVISPSIDYVYENGTVSEYKGF